LEDIYLRLVLVVGTIFNLKKKEVSMKKSFISRTFFILSLLAVPLSAFGHRFAYRAGPYRSEPRLDRNCLTSYDVSVMGGATTTGKNGDHDKVDVLNIYGLHEMRKLGEGLTNLDPLNIDDNILLTLRDKNANGNFGKLLFTGKFKYIGAEVSLTQNWCNGFFGQVIVPVNRVEVTDVAYIDQSPTTGVPASTDADWKQFLARFDNILSRHGMTKGNTSETSIGDVELYLGWSYNNDTSDALDFLDVTIKAGATIPSAKRKDVDKAFSIASGYQHAGIPVSFDMALGVFEWVTWGAHASGCFFFKQTDEFRMKTYSGQNGFIKLAKGAARRDLGNAWDIGTFLKADHIAGGLSVMVGYNYSSQEDSTLTPSDTTTFNVTTVNSDDMLKKWRMHTVNVMAEYDFAKEDKKLNPKVGIFYNHPVGGKRIFNTNTIGGNAGLNIVWKF